MPITMELKDWIPVALAIVSVIITLFPIIRRFREKLSQTKFYKKIELKASIYYLWGIKRKFLIFSIIFFITAVSLLSIFIYQIINPMPSVQSETISPIDFIDEGQSGIFDFSESGKVFLKIDKTQNFVWKRGWNENKKLKRISIDYTTSGTQIVIGLGSNFTPYSLNKTSGTSTLEIENILIQYEENTIYYLGIINMGENSFNLLDIKIEEEISKPQETSIILFLLSYIALIFSINLFKKHKKIWNKEKNPPPDLLKKEAKYADRITNIELELELYQNMLKYLENLNSKGEVSENFYLDKRTHYEDNIIKISNEKETIISEIEDIIRKFKKDEC